MPERVDLATALLSADAAERERLLRSVDPETLEMTLPQVARARTAEAAGVLALVDVLIDDKAVRKAARRELHRLRSMGVDVPTVTPESVTGEPERAAAAPSAIAQAHASDIDPTGSRAVWVIADRPLGGIWFGAVLVNDQTGLEDLNVIDTTRKRYAREWESVQREGATWVELPPAYALALVREAVDLSRATGRALPTRYRSFKEAFGEAPSAPERALIYETISPVEVEFNPTWLEESPQLLTEPELRGWHVAVPSELRQQAVDVARAPGSGLLVPGHTPEGQALALVSQAGQRTLTPTLRRALKRRLEETALIFAQSDRLAAARLAVAAAHALDETPSGPRTPVERHPLLRMLIATGLGRLLGAERAGGRLAAEALLDVIERAASASASGGPVETRPSGLILPR